METEEWIDGEIEGMWGREWKGRREVKLWLVSKINKKLLKKGKKKRKFKNVSLKIKQQRVKSQVFSGMHRQIEEKISLCSHWYLTLWGCWGTDLQTESSIPKFSFSKAPSRTHIHTMALSLHSHGETAAISCWQTLIIGIST